MRAQVLDEKAELRRRKLHEMMLYLYGPDGRREFARDLKVSHSLIATLLRGERPMSERFLLGLMEQMEELLEIKSTQLYEARSIAIDMGRSIWPGFDLPLIQSNAEYVEEMARTQAALEAREAEGQTAEEAEILAQIHEIIRNDPKP
jgi:transcriptional regulator with XRE-family HTH domain